MARIIIDLLGRKLRIKSQPWELVLDPIKEKTIPKGWYPCLTRDRYTGQSFGLYYSPDHKDYIIQIYVPHLRAHIQYPAEFLGYYEQYDMRLEYKYGKTKLPKIKNK